MSENLKNDTSNAGTGGLMGWICPVCGRGLSPYTNSCPCVLNREITCGTGTAAQIVEALNRGELPSLSLNNDDGLYIHKYGY